MARLTLSTLQVDQEQILTQLNDNLSQNPVWIDALTSGVGQTLSNWISSITTYEQYAIQRSLEEAMPDTAQQDYSQYTIARMLGVHLSRKIPGAVPCSLTNTGTATLSIPAYSSFTLTGSIYLFNRTSLVLAPGVAQIVTLYEGQVVNEDFLSAGGPFQKYYVGTANTNTISDLDFIASTPSQTIGGSPAYTSTTQGLWEVGPGIQIFYENTMADGTIEVLFGNGTYGAAPSSGNTITFTYVNTNGASGNSLIVGSAIAMVGNSYVTGTNTGAIANGQDEQTADFYKQFAPFIYSSKQRAVTADDFTALALTYPTQNITDIVFLGQKDTHPKDPVWMNLVQYTLLSTATTFNYSAFEAWLSTFCIFQTNFYNVPATPVATTLKVNVFCNDQATLANVQANVTNVVLAFFAPKIGTLNANMYLSKLYGAITTSDLVNISYVQITTPTGDIIISPPKGTINPPQRYVTLANIVGTTLPNITVIAQYASSPNNQANVIPGASSSLGASSSTIGASTGP